MINGNSMGGIQLRAQKDRIVCNNTLDERLELCYQEGLPEIRAILFPKKPEPPKPVEQEKHEIPAEPVEPEKHEISAEPAKMEAPAENTKTENPA